MFYVYTLKNIPGKLYIGSTNDLKRRLEEHNKGQVFSTKNGKPWRLIYYEAFLSEKDAREREKKLKQHKQALGHLKKRIYYSIKESGGFTLIELLVVVTIIGIIASIVLISMQSIRAKARDSRRVSDIHQMMLAAELYYDDHLKYPEKGVIGMIGKPPASIDPYLVPVPEDPGNIVSACLPEGYRWWGNTSQAQKYCFWACLESGAFFAGSPKGTKTLESAPSGLDCW